MQVQAHDIPHLLDAEGVVGELAGPCQVRLDSAARAPALHGGLGDAFGGPQQAHAPGRGVGRRVVQGAVDHLGHLLGVVAARPTRTQFVVQALHPALEEAPPPLAYRLGRRTDPEGHGLMGQAFGAGQDHAGPQRQAMRQGGRARATPCRGARCASSSVKGARGRPRGMAVSGRAETWTVIIYAYLRDTTLDKSRLWNGLDV